MQNSYAIRPAINWNAVPKIMYGGREFRTYPSLIGDLPAEERPREKLLAQGPAALSTQELTALLLVTGTTKEDILEMTGRVVKDYGEKSIFEVRDAAKLSAELDIPIVKACQIVAAGEIGRRMYDRAATTSVTIKNAADVHEYFADMRKESKEHMRALYLNSRGRIMKDQVISIGTVNSSLVSPREIFNPAIELMCTAVILAHNHPSGDCTASAEDVTMTERIVQAGKILGIHVLDHIIITKDGFASVPATYE